MISKPVFNFTERVYGLDVLRAFAVLFVLVGHTLEHSVVPQSILAFGRLGIIGVELFFVLSGFLIGSIIMRLIRSDQFSSFYDVINFWQRRWLRTLPLYFVVLIVFLRIDFYGRHALNDYSLYFVFMQNFAWKIPNFFELSWSLAIEEHFYLLFPLVYLFLRYFIQSAGKAIIATALIFILTSFGYRLYLPYFSDWEEFNRSVRMAVLPRIDAIMFGVLVAFIKHNHETLYINLRKATPFTAIFCVLISVWWFLGIPGLMSSRALQLSIFTLQSLCFALLLPWFDGLKTNKSEDGFFGFTSRISYSLYLLHIPVIIVVNGLASRLGIFDSLYQNALVLYFLYFSLFYFVAWFSHELIERPFIEMRDQKFTFKLLWKTGWIAFFIAGVFVFFF